jgi:hypothetical protein
MLSVAKQALRFVTTATDDVLTIRAKGTELTGYHALEFGNELRYIHNPQFVGLP